MNSGKYTDYIEKYLGGNGLRGRVMVPEGD